MKEVVSLIFTLSIFALSFAQRAIIAADTVELKSFGTKGANLQIKNNTHHLTGAFLVNKGNGVTEFRYVDSTQWADSAGGIKYANRVFIGSPQEDSIGTVQGGLSNGYKPQLLVENGALIESKTGESLIVNNTDYTGGGSYLWHNNVLAIQSKAKYNGYYSQVPAGIRFLDTVGREMGAIGFSNAGYAPFENALFLSASAPIYPGWMELRDSDPPTRLAFFQEGAYEGSWRIADRQEFTNDWNINFKNPDKVTTVNISPVGLLKVKSLSSGSPAPTTTGTTKMVVTDANGLISFKDDIQKMTKVQRNALPSPYQGLMVFVTDNGGYLSWYNGGWLKVASTAD